MISIFKLFLLKKNKFSQEHSIKNVLQNFNIKFLFANKFYIFLSQIIITN